MPKKPVKCVESTPPIAPPDDLSVRMQTVLGPDRCLEASVSYASAVMHRENKRHVVFNVPSQKLEVTLKCC